MEYSFSCYGHENITARHKTTLEFTKETDLSMKGDCIAGIKADFDLKGIKKFIERLSNNKVTITIETISKGYINKYCNEKNSINNKNTNNKANNTIKKNLDYKNNKIIEKINAEINPNFNSDKDMVIRKSDFIDERTFAVKADKAACDVNKRLTAYLKDGGKVKVLIITC